MILFFVEITDELKGIVGVMFAFVHAIEHGLKDFLAKFDGLFFTLNGNLSSSSVKTNVEGLFEKIILSVSNLGQMAQLIAANTYSGSQWSPSKKNIRYGRPVAIPK
jgi:hypothetical protein